MYQQILRNLGLSENEISVYVAILEIGTSKVDTISQRIPLQRTTIYGILKSLLERGIVSFVIKSGVKHYEAIGPNRLLLMEQEKLQELKKIIPELESLRQTIGKKPVIALFEGKEGIKSIYEDMLKTKGSIQGYGNSKLLFELLEFYIPNYIRKRAKQGIKFLVITEESETGKEMKLKDKKEKRETRFLKGIEDTTTITYSYGNKIALMGLIKRQPFGVIIENEALYNSQKVIFNLLWGSAK